MICTNCKPQRVCGTTLETGSRNTALVTAAMLRVKFGLTNQLYTCTHVIQTNLITALSSKLSCFVCYSYCKTIDFLSLHCCLSPPGLTLMMLTIILTVMHGIKTELQCRNIIQVMLNRIYYNAKNFEHIYLNGSTLLCDWDIYMLLF